MRLGRTLKHENSFKGDREGRPYAIEYLFVGADLASALPSRSHAPAWECILQVG